MSFFGGIKDWFGNLFGGGNSSQYTPAPQVSSGSGFSLLTPQAAGYTAPTSGSSGSSFLSSLFGGGSSNGSSNNSSGGGWTDLLSKIFNPSSLLGTALMGIGLNKKGPETPQLPQSAVDLRSQVQSGGSPLGQQAQQLLSTRMATPIQPMQADEEAAILRRFQIEKGQSQQKVRDMYRSLGRGEGDSDMARDMLNIDTDFAQRESDALATGRRDIFNQYNANQMADIQAAYGFSNAEIQQLTQIAQWDVDAIMKEFDWDRAKAEQFKNIFTNLGYSMVSNQLMPQQSFMDQIFSGMNAGG
ncbi:hypothetical protein KKH13_05200 [Patescibacteria group bacterium]|nr:hypothetical protein [Patescibacteria group bacterium]